MAHRMSLLSVLALAGLVAVAGAWIAGPGAAQGGQPVEVGVQESGCSGGRTFCFSTDELTAQGGQQVTYRLNNNGAAPHSLCFDLPDGQQCTPNPTQGTAPGQSDDVTIVPPAQGGTFRYVCEVPGHESLGMYGNLTVTAATGAGAGTGTNGTGNGTGGDGGAGNQPRPSPGLGLASIAVGVALLAFALRRR